MPVTVHDDVATVLAQATKLSKSGAGAASFEILRSASKELEFTPAEVFTAGRLLLKEASKWDEDKKLLTVLLLGQCNTSWLKYSIATIAIKHGQLVQVTEGAYDQVLQELLSAEHSPRTSQPTQPTQRPDVVVLVPWGDDRLDGGVRETHDQIESEMAFWLQAHALVKERLGSRIVQVGYDYTGPGAGGHHLSGAASGNVGRVRALNAALRSRLPDGAFFVDLEQVSGAMGRENFYSPRRYHWTKQPFSEQGVVRLAEHIWAGIRATTTGPKKVLVLDLDNTLWGGVVGETGPNGITIGDGADGEAFRAFQKHIRDLNSRGVLLAVASKNNPADAREPFTANREMVLNLDHFAAFEASWEPKSVTITRMAKTLSLGLDSFVFFDDNPVERAEVRHELPEVAVVDVPEDPADYVNALRSELWFETTSLTDTDRTRAAQYAVERTRRELQEGAGSIEDYLASLDLRAEVEPIQDADTSRVVQLLSKTNQFNVTTRRHTHEDVSRIIATKGSITLTMRATDRFGDYGLVAVMLGVPCADHEDAIAVDTWLMSCRVIGRTFEHFLFGTFMDLCRAKGYRRILGEYIPTPKNELVKDLYVTMGCETFSTEEQGSTRYFMDLNSAANPQTWVKSSNGLGTADGS